MTLDEPLPTRILQAYVRYNAVFSFVNDSPHGDELTQLGTRVTEDISEEVTQQLIHL